MITVDEIERAVIKLPPEDFAKLAVWMDQQRPKENAPAMVYP
jgi:hypothetical protein